MTGAAAGVRFNEEGDAVFTPLVTSLTSIWLTGLLVLWAALLFGGFLFGRVNAERTGRMPMWARVASSAVLVLAAWSWYLVSRGTTTSIFALLIAIGMSLGLVGDLFMARLLPVAQYVLLGMAAFGLGHLAYIAAGLVYGNYHGLAEAETRYGVWAVWLVVGLIGWYLAVFRGQDKRSTLHWVALPYALLLASTAGVATGLAVQEAALWPMAVGAALFLGSDLILAAHLFNGVFFPLIEDAIWLTYGPGQMLIVYSVAGALRTVTP
jgi:hypothetical protein